MKCPYCDGEMEQGYIQSPYEINWKKGNKRAFLGNAGFHDGSVVLSELSLLGGSAVTAADLKIYHNHILNPQTNG